MALRVVEAKILVGKIMKVIYNSDRKFVVFSYEISHGLLLLRSGKTNTLDKRCDFLFHDVRAVELRFTSDGIKIAQEELSYLRPFRSAPQDVAEYGLVVYSIGNEAWAGYVLGGIVRMAEDDANFSDQSSLLP